jgi:transcriptional regulator with XRE-family HTH domain
MASKTGQSIPKPHPKPALKSSSEPVENEALIAAAMARSGLKQFRDLAQAAATSEHQLRQLRRGQVAQLRVGTIQRVAAVLDLDWRLLADPLNGQGPTPQAPTIQDSRQLQAEYKQLEQRLAQNSARVQLEVQRSALNILEPWLKNWPKVLQAVGTSRPELPVAQVLGLLSPIDRLLDAWDLAWIGAIGETIAFDPTEHVAIEGTATLGDPVMVRRPGYRQGDVLLARAEVAAEVAAELAASATAP